MKKTINKSNWSGQFAVITINQSKKTVALPYGDVLKIDMKNPNDIKVYYEGEVFAYGWYDEEMKEFYLHNGIGEYERSNECIYTVAAQMAFNLI